MQQTQPATATQLPSLCHFRRVAFPGAWFYEVKPQQPVDIELIAAQLRQRFDIHWNRLVMHGLITPAGIHGHCESVWEYFEYQNLLTGADCQGLEVGEWVDVRHV